MSKIYNNIKELIGNTPILRLSGFERKKAVSANIFAKLEYFNPAGSVKDRAAMAMLEDAKVKGQLSEGTVIIEPTSGNTGIGLAALAAAEGYKSIFTMPETMSVERINILKAYGAEVVLTEGAKGMAGAIQKAHELAASHKKAFIPGQFENMANPGAHLTSTGPEIWEAMDGQIDFFVAGVGTGGTISGAGAYLKSKKPEINIIAVEPEGSPMLSKGIKGQHKIQGIGAGFVPNTLNTDIYDEIITVSNDDALNTFKEVPQTDGIFVGLSSGAALFAAWLIASRPENKGKNIVVVLPDTGERYISIIS